ncbi:MAG: 50S ribosomal protein L11 methyltransferase [Aquisalimonadaceae bacterium]
MPFLQISLELDMADAQAGEDVLIEQGALSVTFQDPGGDPVLEPAPGENPLWERITVLGLFDAAVDADEIRQALAVSVGEGVLAGWRTELLEDRAWERVWMDDFTPMRFGRRLWVCPSTHHVEEPEAVVLKLDPGLAFGTGTHPTTALCLRWLDAARLKDAYVVDYGCGSGILAVAALLLGAERSHGVDNDPQALTASRDNAVRNGVDQRLSLALADEPDGARPADVLVANILSGILVQLAPRLARLVRPRGRLVLSGILDTQVEEVSAAYRDAFDLDPPLQDGDWILLSGRRKARAPWE